MERVDVMGTCSRCGKNWNELAQRFGAHRPEGNSPAFLGLCVSFQDCNHGVTVNQLWKRLTQAKMQCGMGCLGDKPKMGTRG